MTENLSIASTRLASRPSRAGTVIFIFGLLLLSLNLGGKKPVDVASTAAYGVGILFAASIVADLRLGGIRNLVRADLFALVALYFLTFFEFLFKQPDFNFMVDTPSTRAATIALFWAFAGILIGRHIPNLRSHPLASIFSRQVPTSWLFTLFWLCFALGFAHMLIAVDFNPVELIKQMMAPRFSQPWQRGRYGDWKALLVELALFLYLLPPITGIMLARRRKYSRVQIVLCVLGFLLLIFYAFTGGTRNLFASYLVTFLIAYAFACPRDRKKEFVILGVACAVVMLFSTMAMLRFRDVGFANYMKGATVGYEESHKSMFVDLNLFAMTRIMNVFPAQHPFLGWEVPYLALIRPIPRAMWPEKPEGLSASIEDAMGVEGMTIAATFAGEAYMAGGTLVIFLSGLVFGYFAGWWGHLASPENSDLGVLIYASGFFATIITMRSMLVFTTALLPTVGVIFIAIYLVGKLKKRAEQRRFRTPPAAARTIRK